MKRIIVLTLLLSVFLLCGCENGPNGNLPPCDPDVIGQNTEFYSNERGRLTVIDVDPDSTEVVLKYFIYSEEVTYFPITPCNIPQGQFNLVLGDTVDVVFTGNLKIVDPRGNPLNLEFELIRIQKIKP